MKILRLTLGPIQGNCYIVYDEDTREGVVIDPGYDGKRIKSVLDEKGVNLQYILLTHAHVDHIGGVPELKSEFPDVPVVMHEDDEDLLLDSNLNMSTQALGYKVSMKPDVSVKDEDVLPFANTQIKVIHTPGHTKGGVCFVIDNSVFTGDTLFRDSIGRSDFYGGDGETLIRSIVEKLMTLPADFNIYPGHMEPSTIGREKERNMFISPYFKNRR